LIELVVEQSHLRVLSLLDIASEPNWNLGLVPNLINTRTTGQEDGLASSSFLATFFITSTSTFNHLIALPRTIFPSLFEFQSVAYRFLGSLIIQMLVGRL
jgi:hypothetical protein